MDQVHHQHSNPSNFCSLVIWPSGPASTCCLRNVNVSSAPAEAFSRTKPNRQPNANLILLTSEEVLGFSEAEIASIRGIADRCRHTIRSEHHSPRKGRHFRFVYLLKRRSAGVHVAPHRWSGVMNDFVSVMEAEAMCIPVVASIDGALAVRGDLPPLDPAADGMSNCEARSDSRHGHVTLYPVKSHQIPCWHEPCRRGRRLCDFPPCHGSTTGCVCQRVAVEPTGFEIDGEDLRVQMERAQADILSNRRRKSATGGGGVNASSAGAAAPCWSDLGVEYHEKILLLVNDPIHRRPPSFLPPDPPSSLRLRRIVRFFVRKVRFVLQIFTVSVMLLYLLSWRFPGIRNLGMLRRLAPMIHFRAGRAATSGLGRMKVN